MTKFECFLVPRQYYGERERDRDKETRDREVHTHAEIERHRNRDMRGMRDERQKRQTGEREGD